ncbi:hypothetical protein BH10BDE1_BH10BDE1_03460 [soil metagenome]
MKLNLKLNVIALSSICVLVSACSKSASLNTTAVGGNAPVVETQASIEQKSRCEIVEKILSQPSAQKLKAGLDTAVGEMTETETASLVEAARVWRRATPSALFTDEVAEQKMQAGVSSANSIGVRMVLQSLVANAPILEPRAGMFFSTTITFPTPGAEFTGKSTQREIFSNVPAYGLSYGESFADSGIGVLGQLYTDLNSKNYTVKMIYSAAASKYAVRVMDAEDFTSVNSEDCSQFPVVSAFVKLPRAQSTLRDCEWGECKNIPKD